jgi:hypothetical protein
MWNSTINLGEFSGILLLHYWPWSRGQEDSPPDQKEARRGWVTWVSDGVVCEGSQVAIGSSFNDTVENRIKGRLQPSSWELGCRGSCAAARCGSQSRNVRWQRVLLSVAEELVPRPRGGGGFVPRSSRGSRSRSGQRWRAWGRWADGWTLVEEKRKRTKRMGGLGSREASGSGLAVWGLGAAARGTHFYIFRPEFIGQPRLSKVEIRRRLLHASVVASAHAVTSSPPSLIT